MAAASHHSVLHAAFIVSTDAGLRAQDDNEDHSLVYAYPAHAPSGSTGGFVKSFSSLIVTVRGALDSICGEKTRLVHLEHGGRRLLLAAAHLESFMLVLALRSVVPPAAATCLALHLAETLLLLLGPCAEWGLGPSAAPAVDTVQQEETRAILDRLFEGVLGQVDSPSWGTRMAPWNCFESSCLHLALPAPLHARLGALLADHGAQRSRAPFSFFRQHSCLMYRGLILASDLHPQHAKQLWQLLWTLGLHQHSGGLPCQVLTRTIHLPHLQLQLQPATAAARPAAAAAGAVGGHGAAAAAAAAVALQAESGLAVSEQQMGRSLLVVAAAMRLVMVVVLTAYDEEIEEELAGRLEGHSAAELLQRVHVGMGSELERLVEGSAMYGAAARALETAPPPPPHPPHPHAHPHQRPDSAGMLGGPARPLGGGGGGSFAGGGSLLFRVITRNRSSSPQQRPDGGDGARSASGGGEALTPSSPSPRRSAPALVSTAALSLPPSGPAPHRATTTSLPPGQPLTPTTSLRKVPNTPTNANANANASSAASGDGGGAVPPSGQPHDRIAAGGGSLRGPGGVGGGGGGGSWLLQQQHLQPPPPPPASSQAVGSPFEGVHLVVVHDTAHGCVRFLGDVPRVRRVGAAVGGGGGGGRDLAVEAALAAVWRGVAACRSRFRLHNVAVAAPPKHARLTMTLDQILQLSAARSNKLGGQRLGTADSSPWQYHPELASLAAVNTVTLRLPLPPLAVAAVSGAAAAAAGSGGEVEGGSPAQQQQQQQPGAAAAVAAASTSPLTKSSWMSRLSGGRRDSSGDGVHDGSPPRGPAPLIIPAATLTPLEPQCAIPEPATPTSGLVPALSGFDSLALAQGVMPSATPQGPVPRAGGGGAAGAGGGGSSSSCRTSLYLTGLLLPDMREVFLVHSAEVDEGRLAEAIWESAATACGGGGAGNDLWGQED